MNEPLDQSTQPAHAGAEPAQTDPSSPQPSSPSSDAEVIDADETVADAPSTLVARPSGRRLGEIMVEEGTLSPEDVINVLQDQSERASRFGEIVVLRGMASPIAVLKALDLQQRRGRSVRLRQAVAGTELVMLHRQMTTATEAIRGLRTQLMAGGGNGAQKAIVVVSTGRGEGKTFVCANLAASIAQLGKRTLIIDAALRTSRQHELFGLRAGDLGLLDLLAGTALLPSAVASVSTLPLLHVLPSGSAHTQSLDVLQHPAFGLLLASVVAQYDHVLVDTDALDLCSDAQEVAQRCGIALMVARKGVTPIDDIKRALAGLQRSGVEVAGLVLNQP